VKEFEDGPHCPFGCDVRYVREVGPLPDGTAVYYCDECENYFSVAVLTGRIRVRVEMVEEEEVEEGREEEPSEARG